MRTLQYVERPDQALRRNGGCIRRSSRQLVKFDDRDMPGMPTVVVVSESYARTSWPGENPIGKRLYFQQGDPIGGMEVVGLAGDVKPFVAFGQPTTLPPIYIRPVGGSPRLVVRTLSGAGRPWR
jgi:hypothetical protein